MSNYKMPSHDPFHKPGDEGSCPPMPTESINGKDFPNGDQSAPMVGAMDLPKSPDKGMKPHSGGGANPVEAMPGA